MADIRRYGVAHLAVFGSVSRGEETSKSDIDILVEFERPIGLFGFVRLQRLLEEIIGRPVDLTTPDALRPEMRESILGEAIYAA